MQNKPFLFLKYKDTTAKISPDSSRRLLYRYCSPGGLVKPPKLNKLNDKTSWDSREKEDRGDHPSFGVNQMVVYLQRLQSMRDPYPSPDAALTKRFEDAFPYTLTPDQCTYCRNHGRFATRFSDGSLGHRRRRFREDGSRHARDVSRRQHGRRRVHDGTDDGVGQQPLREPPRGVSILSGSTSSSSRDTSSARSNERFSTSLEKAKYKSSSARTGSSTWRKSITTSSSCCH